jgi:hypothetical protein
MLLNAHSIKVLLVPFKNIFTVGIIYKEPYAIVESWSYDTLFKNFVIYGTPREVNLFVDQVSEFVNERKL